MDSFKIYLPSNACSELYPHNTSSDYRTRFDKAIDLEGDWEVGVESIMYASLINDERERGQLKLSAKIKDKIPINNIYSYEFALKPDGTWAGFDGVVPDDFETDPKNHQGIVDTLNRMTRQIVTKQRANRRLIAFNYSPERDEIIYMCVNEAYTMELTAKLGQVLGFGYRTILWGGVPHRALYKRETDVPPLTKDDYCLTFFNSDVLKMKKRVFLDLKSFLNHKDENCDKCDADDLEKKFIELWNYSVFPASNVKVHFKNHKLILRKFGEEAIILSPDLMKTFYHASAFFATLSERWAISRVNFESIQSSDMWYVDIYSNETETTYQSRLVTFELEAFPWKFNTVRKALIYLNREVNKMIRNIAKEHYDETNHKFHFDLDLSNHCSLDLGKWMQVTNITSNLSYLLGFPQTSILQSMKSSRATGILLNRSRQLYLLSDMAQTTVHGNKRLPLLCDFLHNSQNEKVMCEKRFNPISFIPVVKPRLDFIHLQLTNDQYEPVKIRDIKTLVTLYFQRIK